VADAPVWGALAHIYVAEHSFAFKGCDNLLDLLERAKYAAQRALTLDPQDPVANCVLALIYYHQQEHASFLAAVRNCVALESGSRVDILATLGMYLAHSGDWERGLVMLDQAMRLNPRCPGWLALPRALNAYRLGDYKKALAEARKINLPDFFWDPLLQAMIYAQLDRRDELETAVNRLVKLKPGIFHEITRLLNNLLRDKALIDHCLNGFNKISCAPVGGSQLTLRIHNKVA
jgi:tetratricopeptide (TPR) repeat protein